MQNGLKVYNSITREKEEFQPLNPPFVGMYLCGQTVYKDIHIGNLRTMTSFDMIYRYLKYIGYKVRFVRNITDVGHLLGDVDEGGEDKLASQAKVEQLEPMEIAHKYTLRFHEAMAMYNNLPPDIEPIASGHIPEQIKMVDEIVKNGYGYEKNGSVYFDVMKYREKYNYGKLSGKVIEDLMSESRELGGTDDKKNPVDFVIWRYTPPEHIMQWESPWGNGVPGWHLECSVMSTKYLGQQFDIHGGGMDLKFPHHECEIAQNVGASGVEPVKYWLHANMLTVEGSKMSKSLGNGYTPWDIVTGDHPHLERGYDPMVIRFFFMQTHYSSPLDYTSAGVEAAEKGFKRLMNGVKAISHFVHTNGEIDEALNKEVNGSLNMVIESMNDDFNTAKALADLFDLTKIINSMVSGDIKVSALSEETFERFRKEYTSFIHDVLGLEDSAEGNDEILDEVMKLLIEIRNEARAKKDFETSDKIRDQLAAINVQLKDGKDGTSWVRN